MKEFIKSLSGSVPLKRKGARLSSALGSWQMLGVHGPLSPSTDAGEEGREFFRIETTAKEILLVYRRAGERGMRELFLCDVSGERALAQQTRAS